MSLTQLSPKRGILLALASATAFGGITPLASLTYNDGTTALAVLFVRTAFGAVAFAAAALLLGRRLGLTWGAWLALLPVTISWLVGSIGYLGAVRYLPVGLAAILFFTFPVIVATASWVVERRRPRAVELLLVLFAFAGLVLAVGPSFAGLNPLGLLLAMIGATGAAAIFLTGRYALARTDQLVALVHVNTINALGTLGLGLAFGAFVFPAGDFPLDGGWPALTAATVLFAFAVFFQFGAIRHAGAPRAAMFFNLEPVITLAIATLLLGEQLSPIQLLGGAMVITALVLFSRQAQSAGAS